MGWVITLLKYKTTCIKHVNSVAQSLWWGLSKEGLKMEHFTSLKKRIQLPKQSHVTQ